MEKLRINCLLIPIIPAVMQITTNTCPEASARLAAFFPAAFAWGRLRSGARDCAALVDLTGLDDEEAEHLLSDAEQEFFQQLRHPKRRREWLGGRIAAKAALLNLPEDAAFAAQARRLTILPDAQGRPKVSGGADSLTLSITHSGRYAAALAAPGRHCGIDLQIISAKLPLLTKYFAAAAELELLAGQPDIGEEAAALTMLWAVKEAVKKSLAQDQPGMFAGIAAEGIAAAGGSSWHFDCGAQSAMVYIFPPYVLALTSGAAIAVSPSFLG